MNGIAIGVFGIALVVQMLVMVLHIVLSAHIKLHHPGIAKRRKLRWFSWGDPGSLLFFSKRYIWDRKYIAIGDPHVTRFGNVIRVLDLPSVVVLLVSMAFVVVGEMWV